MKRIILLAMLVLATVIYVWAGSYKETRTWTDTFTYLQGDSTVADTTEVFYYEPNFPAYKYRFNKLQYQADVTFGGMTVCTALVTLEQGPGTTDNPYDTIKTFIITGDSTYATTGYNLIYTWLADSAKPDIRIKVTVMTDADDSGASAGEKVDSSYTIAHTIHAWGRD